MERHLPEGIPILNINFRRKQVILEVAVLVQVTADKRGGWGRWLSPSPWGCLKDMWMWCWGTWFTSEHSSAGLKIGLSLQGLFQHEWLCYISCREPRTCWQLQNKNPPNRMNRLWWGPFFTPFHTGNKGAHNFSQKIWKSAGFGLCPLERCKLTEKIFFPYGKPANVTIYYFFTIQ